MFKKTNFNSYAKKANKAKGNFIENHAAAYLMRQGYEILARNYSYRGGELDIVAQDNDTTVFVEVKSVWNNAQGNPAARVNFQKQKKIWKTACHFLCTQIHNLDKKSRFDVLSIRAYEHPLKFAHYKNAFESTQVIPYC